jgi:YidC/Oxa1 family membrane protein insertase
MFKDKNTVIGFTLMAILMFAYFTITTKQSREAQRIKQIEQLKKDSIDNANKPKLTAADTIKLVQDSIDRVKGNLVKAAGTFQKNVDGTEQLTVVENELVKFEFSNKGGSPKNIFLKKFKNKFGQQVKLLGDSADKFGYAISTGINTSSLFFTPKPLIKNADGSSTLTFELKDSTGNGLEHEYTIKPNSYVYQLKIKGANKMVTNNTMSLVNEVMVQQQDNDKSYEVQSSKFVVLKNGDFDDYDAQSTRNISIEKPVKWLGFKQRFFNSTMLSNTDIKNINLDIVKQPDTSSKMYLAKATTLIPVTANGTVDLQFFVGPNDYNQLKAFNEQAKNIVQLHSVPFGFVKWINRGVVMPVFDWLLKNAGGVGLAIALLTLFIRLLTAPLMLPSYRNSAKMKILRPELDKLKEKFKDDQQGFAVEQMKFLKQAGVNQLQGCLPSLLQIPIFFALFALFTAHVGIRGENFLWAKDLAMFDNPIKFGFNIPLLGDHLSLFAVAACITSFFISLYSMSATPDTGNPVLKYMPYFFPIIMLFIFNKLPSALTWYYTVSNVVTLLIQFFINKFVIDPEKLKVQIEENKKKVKPKSKFQERYEQMLEAQKQAQQKKK